MPISLNRNIFFLIFLSFLTCYENYFSSHIKKEYFSIICSYNSLDLYNAQSFSHSMYVNVDNNCNKILFYRVRKSTRIGPHDEYQQIKINIQDLKSRDPLLLATFVFRKPRSRSLKPLSNWSWPLFRSTFNYQSVNHHSSARPNMIVESNIFSKIQKKCDKSVDIKKMWLALFLATFPQTDQNDCSFILLTTAMKPSLWDWPNQVPQKVCKSTCLIWSLLARRWNRTLGTRYVKSVIFIFLRVHF